MKYQEIFIIVINYRFCYSSILSVQLLYKIFLLQLFKTILSSLFVLDSFCSFFALSFHCFNIKFLEWCQEHEWRIIYASEYREKLWKRRKKNWKPLKVFEDFWSCRNDTIHGGKKFEKFQKRLDTVWDISRHFHYN